MLTIYPSFFPDFQCKADRCRHTCCQTWEIDIDADTEQKYRKEPGPLGRELSQWMTTGEGGLTCFKLNEKGYCHFLNEKGLCRLVLEKGDDFLCDICTNHPRFYKYIGDFELCGTGLCCEKTCEDLAKAEGSLTFLAEGNAPFVLPDLVYTLGVELSDDYYEWAPDLDRNHVQHLVNRLAQTEPIDQAWTDHITFMVHHPEAVLAAGKKYLPHYDPWLFQRLYHYIWYRQLDMPVPMERIAAFARESTNFIYFTAALSGNPLIAAAMWSEQVEYDDANIRMLLQ